ncbi:hypothetical protein NEOLEDRAFT_193948 [Neolentinus lepideus HHB14362 ss-1]|uniref:Uncharacterized protein n=1 Tax=Neolentinus lepideus HHB14362 ss-1 TaxID=1314782 RepID=A0A165MFE2_9AGAM|nr:hypothetical protein NEOLEDRAFT_193948 [Neolentinus lepideus HHB14362 ss-1]
MFRSTAHVLKARYKGCTVVYKPVHRTAPTPHTFSPAAMNSIADMSIIELRGLPTEGLVPGSRITVGNEEYEYLDSDDEDSIDDAPGPGRTLYKQIKRVSAPVEMFISYCSDLAGNGPDALFERALNGVHRSRSSLGHKRKHTGLYYWAGFPHLTVIYPGFHDYRCAARLIDFVM